MDFTLNEEQQAVQDLAEQIFAGSATAERVKEVEAGPDRVDWHLWAQLAEANLLGIALPEEAGGSGLGILELALLLEQQGRRVAPLPLLATLVMAALPIAEFGTSEQRAAWLPRVVSGDAVLTAALAETGDGDATRPSSVARKGRSGDWRLQGRCVSVPYGHVAACVLVPARTEEGLSVFLVDPADPGVDRLRAETTNHEIHPHLLLDDVPGDRLGGPANGRFVVKWMLERSLVGIAALQVGVAEEALRQAADYTSNRIQFGRPLSTFQGTALKAADAYIDTEAMRVTLWQAAWRLSAGRDATAAVSVAKWWASQGGQQVVHSTQHLHGGLGSDIEYPVHRYFLWGKQLEDTLGGAGLQLARLGRHLATVDGER
jgi:acyl-CoA dehydrogenase